MARITNFNYQQINLDFDYMDQSIHNQHHKRLALLWLLFAIFCMSGMAQSVTTYSGFTPTGGSYYDLDYSGTECDKFVDGDNTTKWYCASGGASVPDGETESCYWVDFHYSEPVFVAGYVLTSSQNISSHYYRNPKSWVLKGKMNSSDTWTTIATVTESGMNNVNGYDYNFALDVPGTYRYFRFMSKVSSSYDDGVEVAEFRLLSRKKLPTPTGLTVTLTPGNGTLAGLGWTSEGDATSCQVCVDEDEANLIEVSTNSCSLTGLTSGSTHVFKVRSLSENGLSDWSPVCYFVTTDDNALTLYGDATSTLEYSPVNSWMAEYLTKNQFFIPSSALSDVAIGSYISQLVFYSVNESSEFGTARYDVYMGESEQSYFTSGDDFVPWSSLSQVYDGCLSVSGHTMYVVFDHPYQYQGGNLVIGFSQSITGSYIKTEWYGESCGYFVDDDTWAFPACYYEGSNLVYGYLIPKTTLIYSSAPPSVIRPSDLTCSLTQGDGTVATLSWTENGSATTWEICLNDDEEHLILSSSPSFTLSDLTPETVYTAKVRSVNGEERSRWSESLSFKPTDNYTLTLNDGTDTNANVPIHKIQGYYTDSFGSKSQFIIPSESLSSLTGSYINRLTFYAADLNYDFGAAEYDVKMGTATGAVFLIDPSTGEPIIKDWDDSGWETVYSGSLSVSGYIMEINFATPYHYEGGNLQIGINQTVTAPGKNCSWYGENQSEYTSVGGYHQYGGSPQMTCEQFLPKTTIGYTLDDPRAIKVPKNLSVSYEGGANAEVSWSSTESGWDLKLKNVLTEDSVVVENVTSPYTLTNLDLATKYEVRVRSRRDNVPVVGTILSEWTEAETFITDLAPDGDWCQIGLYLSDTSGDGWTGNTIRVEDVLTGKEIATVSNSSEAGAGEEQLISVDVPVGRKIQLVWVQGENPSDCSWRVVDVNREDICTSTGVDVSSLSAGDVLAVYTVDCTISPWHKPSGLTVRPLVSQATVDWQENSDPAATSWILAYKAADTDFMELTVNAHPYALESLSAETTYILKVRPDTGAGGVEKWSEEVEFTMNADYVVPYDLSATVDASESTASLSWSGNSSQYNVRYRKKASFFEDFESGIPSSWTCVDADGDGHGWDVFTYTTGPSEVPVDGLVEGGKYPSSESFDADNNQSLTPDNWLITPRIPLRGTLKVGLRGYTLEYTPENFAIYLSTTGTSVSDFTKQLVDKTGATSSFVEQTVDLSLYEGQTGYIAIRHFDTEDKLRLLVDDFGLYESDDWTSLSVDDPSTVIEHLDANSLYEFQVQGLNPDLAGGTAWSSIYSFFTYTGSFTQKGDVNRDGTLNVEDVTALVNIIQHRDKAEYNYEYNAADLNGDGEYNVIDVTMLINLIQGR